MEIYTDRPKWWKSQAFRSLGPGAVLPPMDMTPGHVCDGMIYDTSFNAKYGIGWTLGRSPEMIPENGIVNIVPTIKVVISGNATGQVQVFFHRPVEYGTKKSRKMRLVKETSCQFCTNLNSHRSR